MIINLSSVIIVGILLIGTLGFFGYITPIENNSNEILPVESVRKMPCFFYDRCYGSDSDSELGIIFNDDGTTLYVMDDGIEHEYSCSAGWDLTTCIWLGET